jgi:hypothetical protein
MVLALSLACRPTTGERDTLSSSGAGGASVTIAICNGNHWCRVTGNAPAGTALPEGCEQPPDGSLEDYRGFAAFNGWELLGCCMRPAHHVAECMFEASPRPE